MMMKKNQTEDRKLVAALDHYIGNLVKNETTIKEQYGGFKVLDILFDPGFVKKFKRAKELFEQAMIGIDLHKKLEMAQMLNRAYAAAFTEIGKHNIKKLDPWVKVFAVDNHVYYVFENQDYLEAVKKVKAPGKNISYISIEELLRCIPKDLRQFRETLNTFDATIEEITYAK